MRRSLAVDFDGLMIEGIVEVVIFESDDGRFSVFKIKPSGNKGLINVTTNAPAPLVGEQVELIGEWTSHPKFGEQFKATGIKRIEPTNVKGIERFLASGAILFLLKSLKMILIAWREMLMELDFVRLIRLLMH